MQFIDFENLKIVQTTKYIECKIDFSNYPYMESNMKQLEQLSDMLNKYLQQYEQMKTKPIFFIFKAPNDVKTPDDLESYASFICCALKLTFIDYSSKKGWNRERRLSVPTELAKVMNCSLVLARSFINTLLKFYIFNVKIETDSDLSYYFITPFKEKKHD